MSFTPGPWLITDRNTVYALTPYLGKSRHGILREGVNRFSAQLQGGNVESASPEEMAANACLMAASPLMYEALKEMREVLDSCARDVAGTPTESFFQSKVRHCDIVLAKAGGR